MFARDFNALNDLYNTKIINENVGLGPHADNQDVAPTPNKISKIVIPKRPCGENEEHCTHAEKGCKCSGCGECKANQSPSEDCEGHNPETYDSNGKMSRQLLFRVFKLSAMLHDLLNGKENVEAWVLSKITNAHDQLESVFGYEDYEKMLNPAHGMCGDNFEESNEEELYSAISKGGDVLLKRLNDVLKRESAENLEKVLLETILILEKKKKLA